MNECVRIHDSDTVAVALRDVPRGWVYMGVTLLSDVKQGHKFALVPIPEGDSVIKYGYPIGRATCDILPGEHVHTHNIESLISPDDEYSYSPAFKRAQPVEMPGFTGFKRPCGKVGVRNEIWVIPLVGCVNDIAAKIALDAASMPTDGVDGIYAFTHPYGCSQIGDNLRVTGDLLASLSMNPNAAGVLVVGLGCENLTMDCFKQRLGDYDGDRYRFLNCQDVTDEYEAAAKMIAELCDYARSFKREPCPASDMVIGLKCGGSDGLSGITANPALGFLSDKITSGGGSVIMTEVSEMFGAERALFSMCESEAVFDKLNRVIAGFKRNIAGRGLPVYENPSPGNISGGISTLDDKSLGCTAKCGSAAIRDVISYAGVIRKRGLSLLESPSNDLVSSTALAAAGAQAVLFTTGRGTPFGCPVPTLKVASNSELARKKPAWTDFDAGRIASGETVSSVSNELLNLLYATLNGDYKAKNERNCNRGIAIYHDGITM